MKNWWDNLALRERIMVLAGTGLILLLLLYQTIVAPIHNGLANLRITTQDNAQLLAWMTASEKNIQNLRKKGDNPKTISNNALLSTVDNLLRQSPINHDVTSIQQNNNNTVTVKFNRVSFDELTQWMINARQQYGIDIQQLVISKVSETGMVQADCSFYLNL